MADFVTHSFTGAASNPTDPYWGGVLGNASDGAQVLAAFYISIRDRKVNLHIWSEWHTLPQWIRTLNAWLHSILLPLIALFVCAWVRWFDAMPYILAYASHPLIDIWTHDTARPFAPFSPVELSIGQTYHSLENLKRGSWRVMFLIVFVAVLFFILSKP